MNPPAPESLGATTISLSDPAGFAILATIGVLVLATGIWLLIGVWSRGVVNSSSSALRELKALNETYSPSVAAQPPLRFDFRYSVNSKPKFDRFDLAAYMHGAILENQGWFTQEISRRVDPTNYFQDYLNALGRIGSAHLGRSSDQRLKPERFQSLEQKLFTKRGLAYPQPAAHVTFTVTYTSPKGQNSYARNLVCDFNQLQGEYYRAVEARARQSTVQARRQRERSLMSDALRVQILRRDNSRCKMCGISATDGATLHVDHIVPVSHGGRTTPENLQALCDSCNMGKSNRFVG